MGSRQHRERAARLYALEDVSRWVLLLAERGEIAAHTLQARDALHGLGVAMRPPGFGVTRVESEP
jgi:hypothetical protein